MNQKETLAMTPTFNYSKIRPWVIWGLSALFYFYEYFVQVTPNVIASDLMKAFHISATTLGNISAIYFWAYAAIQIPVGILLDRFGPRKLLTIAALLCMLGNLFFASAHGIIMASVGRLFIGLGSSFAAISCLKLAANWFKPNRFAFLTGLMLTAGTLGAVFGTTPFALLVSNLGWRNTMLGLGILGGILAVVMWSIIRDQPQDAPERVSSHKNLSFSEEATFLFKDLKQIFSRAQNWIVAIYGGLMYAPTSTFGALWGISFLMTAYQISKASAGTLVAAMFVGWAIGAPIFGAFSDHIRRRKPPLIIGAFGALITMTLVIYGGFPKSVGMILLFFFGVFSSAFLPSFSIIRESNPGHLNATSLGFMNCLNMVGGAVLQPLIGFMLDQRWDHVMHDGVRVYSLQNFHWAMFGLPLFFAIALVLVPFVRETHCKVKE